MITERFLMGRGRSAMTAEEKQVVEDSISTILTLPGRHTLVRHGERVDVSTLLLEGFICRYMDDRNGHRQLVAMHVPGDFVDLHAFPMKHLDHDVATLGPVKVAVYDHRTLVAITEQHPRLTRLMWYSTLLDSAMHREWIFRLGRLGAEERVAHFFSELDARLTMVGLNDDGVFQLPITQSDLAEAVGLTGVHVNRVLRTLRERGFMTFRSGVAHVLDRAALHGLGEFEPAYLYADQANWIDIY